MADLIKRFLFWLILDRVQGFLIWLVFDGPSLGRLAPWVLGLALGRKPHKVENDDAITSR